MVDLTLTELYPSGMRIILSVGSREKLFHALAQTKKGWKEIAANQNISVRTLRDWKRGKFFIPHNAFESLLVEAGLSKENLSASYLPDFWNVKEAASKGGLARGKLYGNFGTPEGRRRGGLASLATHIKSHTNFKALKRITTPAHSTELAECMGVLIGDGHLSEYQASVTTNSETDKQHAEFIKRLLESLFAVSAVLKVKAGERSVTVVASSKVLVNFLRQAGMPLGNKIRGALSIPRWVFENGAFQRAFIRGLFDTDGCIYLDTHRIKEKIYKHLSWTITSYADTLIEDILKLLKSQGFSPTYRTSQKSVHLRKQAEIQRYFKEIGTHNSKHAERYKSFSGRVPKWS
ncbi:MAG: hypothetical protein HYT42_00965 [Candidatus Sungbacteria bacterium]|nr:hypothetical protein [Candidatus Sungbacteria bacterium]